MADNDFPAYKLKSYATSYTRVFGVADYESDIRFMKFWFQDEKRYVQFFYMSLKILAMKKKQKTHLKSVVKRIINEIVKEFRW